MGKVQKVHKDYKVHVVNQDVQDNQVKVDHLVHQEKMVIQVKKVHKEM